TVWARRSTDGGAEWGRTAVQTDCVIAPCRAGDSDGMCGLISGHATNACTAREVVLPSLPSPSIGSFPQRANAAPIAVWTSANLPNFPSNNRDFLGGAYSTGSGSACARVVAPHTNNPISALTSLLPSEPMSISSRHQLYAALRQQSFPRDPQRRKSSA